jgi:hypothetical protein
LASAIAEYEVVVRLRDITVEADLERIITAPSPNWGDRYPGQQRRITPTGALSEFRATPGAAGRTDRADVSVAESRAVVDRAETQTHHNINFKGEGARRRPRLLVAAKAGSAQLTPQLAVEGPMESTSTPSHRWIPTK